MSELKVSTLESNNTLSANSLFAGDLTINSTGITTPLYTINTAAIAIGNSISNNIITSNSIVKFVAVDNANNVFPNPLDIYAWASLASNFNNCTVSRDTTIPLSPAGGIPFKVTPTGADPYPATYNSNTWNLANTGINDIWKISGYIRADEDVVIGSSEFLLILPANSIGGLVGGANSQPTVIMQGNTWTYFDHVFKINDTATTAKYIQIRPDGYYNAFDPKLIDFWYDGLTLQRVISNNSIITEMVNTQIFTTTGSGTWTKPAWATDGKELVVVHMWGGGGGGAVNAPGGGGAFVFGYFIANNLSATQTVVVGAGGVGGNPSGTVGGSSSFANLVAYGGGWGTANASLTPTVTSGGGGGWFSAGGNTSATSGGGPLGGTYTFANSTFGGGAAGNTGIAGDSVYGGGGGAGIATGTAGDSIFGGGGGAITAAGGKSYFGGTGGSSSSTVASAPGGGGGGNFTVNGNGARGEVRVYTYRIVS